MKRIIIVALILSFVMPIYSETMKKLIPLTEKEKLDYSYNQNSYILSIFKLNGTEKQVYYESLDALWGGYQISKDRKSMIFWKDNFESLMPLYYLDGRKGEITLLGNFPLNTRLDENGNYLIYEKEYKSGIFTIQKLDNSQLRSEIVWKISNKEKWTARGGTFSILRASENDEYDYMLLFGIERRTIAKAFYNISTNSIITEFDDSDLSEIELRETDNYQSDYTGWY